VVAGDLPDHLRLAFWQFLDVDVEVRPVAAGCRIRDAPAVGREVSRVVDGIWSIGEIRHLAVFEKEDLRAFVATGVHDEEEPVLRRRV
jgi:hypothetical protein